MRRRQIAVLVMFAIAAVGLAGSGGTAPPTARSEPSDADVVRDTGLATVELGATRAELAREHGLTQGEGDCAPRLPEYASASPVLADDRLVLLWAHPPLRTPEGLAVGSPVGDVRAAHPDAEELTAPPGSYRFDGLLAEVDDRAYLFLHDQERVQKLVVGYADAARHLFHDGFGTC